MSTSPLRRMFLAVLLAGVSLPVVSGAQVSAIGERPRIDVGVVAADHEVRAGQQLEVLPVNERRSAAESDSYAAAQARFAHRSRPRCTSDVTPIPR